MFEHEARKGPSTARGTDNSISCWGENAVAATVLPGVRAAMVNAKGG